MIILSKEKLKILLSKNTKTFVLRNIYPICARKIIVPKKPMFITTRNYIQSLAFIMIDSLSSSCSFQEFSLIELNVTIGCKQFFFKFAQRLRPLITECNMQKISIRNCFLYFLIKSQILNTKVLKCGRSVFYHQSRQI